MFKPSAFVIALMRPQRPAVASRSGYGRGAAALVVSGVLALFSTDLQQFLGRWEGKGLCIVYADKFTQTGGGPWEPMRGNLSGDPGNAIAHLLNMKRGTVLAEETHPLAASRWI